MTELEYADPTIALGPYIELVLRDLVGIGTIQNTGELDACGSVGLSRGFEECVALIKSVLVCGGGVVGEIGEEGEDFTAGWRNLESVYEGLCWR